MIAMKKIITILLFVLSTVFFVVGLVAGAIVNQERTLEVAFKFIPPSGAGSEISGYTLQQGGAEVCNVNVAEVTSSGPDTFLLSCTFFTVDGTFDFTLSAYYVDGTPNPISPPFPYTIGSSGLGSGPAGDPLGNKIITYAWGAEETSDIAGFRMYMNEDLLCETETKTASSLQCKADLINAPMAFSVTSYDSGGVESDKSNILTLDPDDFPEIFVKKSLSFDFNYEDSSTSGGGFRIYINEQLLCSSVDPSIRQMTCEGMLVDGKNSFTIQAVAENGDETLASSAVVYYQDDSTGTPGTTPPDQESLEAQFVATVSSGEAPLAVTFDASSSTGVVSSFAWDFGDGGTGSTSVKDHTFTYEGSYNVTLTVSDDSGQSDVKQMTIIVLPSSSVAEPPSAVISSTTAAGDAPLEVTFDGSGSKTSNPPITYAWEFGDGYEGNGATASHTYTTAGIYHTRLTVSDASGLSSSVDTPVLVTSTAPANQTPQAMFTVTPTTGECPLTIQLDGSESNDPDGSISSYSWNLGDGSSRTGSKVGYTFNNPASYTISLQVTDDSGGVSETTQSVTCTSQSVVRGLIAEVGEVTIDEKWVFVSLEQSFDDPVVIAGPPSANGSEPALALIRNITPTGFEIRLKEWDYQDGKHAFEQVSYIVVEKGSRILESGDRVEAGYFNATHNKVKVNYQQPFTSTPVVLTTIVSENDNMPVTGRLKNVTQDSFEYSLQEEEGSVDQSHLEERIAYVAWKPGKGKENGLIYEVAVTGDNVKHKWKSFTMQSEFVSLPYILANMQTKNGSDPATTRQKNLTMQDVEIRVEEEKSATNETRHTTEVIGILIIGSEQPQQEQAPSESDDNAQEVTFNWEFETALENAISGFRVYNNGNMVCEVQDRSSRTITCQTLLQTTGNSFAITAVEDTGEETMGSNTIQYQP